MVDKIEIGLIMCGLFINPVSAQYWVDEGCGTGGQPRGIASDGEQLVAIWQTQPGGTVNEVVLVDNSGLHYLPTDQFDNQITCSVLYQGVTYVNLVGINNGVYRYANNMWEIVLEGSAHMKVHGEFLYLFLSSSTDTINGEYFNLIAAYDGTNFHAVDNDLMEEGGSGFADIYDVIWYENEFYVGGNISLPGFYEIVRWNPETDVWSDVDGGFPGVYLVMGLIEYHELLIIYGWFDEASGSPGNNIVAWDGDRFWKMGTGSNSQIKDAVIFNDELYISGYFTEVNGVPAEGFAKWNGHQWCGFPAGSSPSHMTVFRDSIYGIQVKNTAHNSPDPYIRLGRWVYDGEPLGCAETEAIGMGEVDGREMTLSLSPNPATSHLRIQCEKPMGQLTITDAMGRVVLIKSMEPQTTNYEIETSSLYPGLYVLRAETESGWRSARFVRE